MPQNYSVHYEQFERIDGAKRERILGAALQEFADHDYAQASTNAIVKRAKISKGLLFHYFGDKAGLLRYLLDSITKAYTEEVLSLVGLDTTQPNDVFDVLKLSINVKFDILRRYLLETRLCVRVMKADLPAELRQYVDEWVAGSYDTMASLAESLNEDLLKEDIDKRQAAKLISWACEGMTNEMLAEISPELSMEDFQKLSDEAGGYMDFLRQLLYREE
jgi:AcrR family transcriptional regulator